MSSLDESPINYFYFKVTEQNSKDVKIYKYNRKLSVLIPLFKSICESTEDSNSEETAVHIHPVYIKDDCKYNNEFWINTVELFDVVMNYLKIWEDNPEKANYVKKECIQTGNINQILKKEDLDLIENFINQKLSDKKFQNPIEYKYQAIASLNPLIKMVDGFLGMEGFAYKIYAYITTIIWNCNMSDINHAQEDPIFKELQKVHVEEYNRLNNINDDDDDLEEEYFVGNQS